MAIFMNNSIERRVPDDESLNWSSSMWPLDESILESIDPELLPTREALKNIQYPWEFWKMMTEVMTARINETRTAESVKIDSPSTTVIEGPVWIGQNVRIMPHATVKGPVYIGANSIIGDAGIVRGSYIGPETVVGERTSVVRSIVGRGCNFHWDYVGDSLLGANVNFGGFVYTANVRVDNKSIIFHPSGNRVETDYPSFGAVIGAGTRLGGNSGTMPGVLVGKDCLIYGNVSISRNVPDRSQVQIEQHQIITPRP